MCRAALLTFLALTTLTPALGCRSDSHAQPATLPLGASAQPAGSPWNHTLLVVFADMERDTRLADQRQVLGPGISELQRRDVRIIEVVGPDPLRDALEVPPDGFHVVIVDRANVVQLRESDVVPLAVVLAHVANLSPVRSDR